MKMVRHLRSAAIAVALFGSCLSPAQARVTAQFDKFKGETSIMLVPDRGKIGGAVQLFVVGAVTSGPEKQYKGTLVDLAMATRDWRYLECYSTHWLADGVPVEMPIAGHSGSVRDGGVIEHIQLMNVSWASLVQLAAAKQVEFEICNDEYRLDSVTQADLRRFVAKVQEAVK